MNTEGACPYCGFDGTGYAEKYPLALRPDSILNGRYILGHVLGQGGFGITYLAWDDSMKERVAIKEYLPAEFANRSAGSPSVQVYSGDRAENFVYGRAQFLEEAKTLAAFIGDSHIVRIYSYFEENGTAYFCMEYVDGLPLDKYMAAKGGRLTPDEADRLLLPLMESLEKVHAKGIVHRDIAPDNVLVTKDGRAKLIDFGAARYSTGEKSKSLDVILKHGFAPYEQYMRRGRQGPWTDVYALAATYYYTVTSRVPPESVERIQEDTLVPPSALGVRLGKAEDVLLHALEVFSNDRIQNMGEFRRAMLEAGAAPETAAEGKTSFVPEPPVAPAAKPESVKKKTKLPLILGAVAAVVLLIVYGMGFTERTKPTVTSEPDKSEEVITWTPSVTSLNYASGGTAGNYYGFSSVIANVLNEKYKDVLNINVESTGASRANIQMLDDGQADIAIVQSDVIYYAYTGTALFSNEDPVTSFSAVCSCYPEYVQILAKKDITSIDQLRGKNVSVGDIGSGTEWNAYQILGSYGISFDDIVVVNKSFADSATALKNGTIDAAFVVAGYPTTAITELATSFDFNLLPVDDEHADALKADYGFYYYGKIPSGTYSPVANDVPAVAVVATIVASNKVSDDAVYFFVKGLFDYKDNIAAGHSKGKDLSLNTAVSGVSIPWHNGAVKYYREKGLM
ncbi:MAG: TAXI family TRAP transporter solute-binding subunit [Oscillospiraceae bacterium]|nr:TAXI family TRAP transporter solute-binding subunit [Oscillospiraceae bacterium]